MLNFVNRYSQWTSFGTFLFFDRQEQHILNWASTWGAWHIRFEILLQLAQSLRIYVFCCWYGTKVIGHLKIVYWQCIFILVCVCFLGSKQSWGFLFEKRECELSHNMPSKMVLTYSMKYLWRIACYLYYTTKRKRSIELEKLKMD